MTLSGSTNFNMTAKQLIENAFAKNLVKKMEQPLLAPELQDGLDILNMMMKAWQAQGLHLWTMEEGVLFLDVGVTNYKLGVDGDHSCALDDFIPTELSADVAVSATVIPVDDTVGMEIGDHIGIEISNNVRQWSTIVTVDSLTQVTIADPLEDEAAQGNSVFTYTDLALRPMRILSFRRTLFGTDQELEVVAWPRNKYFNQTNKNSQGTVIIAYYSPQLTDGKVYIWQTASSVNQMLRYTYEKPLDDIDISTQDVEFPTEWYECITDNLAARLGPMYQVPASLQARLDAVAAKSLDDMLGWDEEMESMNVYPTGYN